MAGHERSGGRAQRWQEVGISTAVDESARGGPAGAGGPTAAAEVARLRRRREGRLIAGVAAGIAAHLGVPVIAVRAMFVVLMAFNGLGVLLYAVFWAVLPAQPVTGKAPRGRMVALLAFAALALGLLVVRVLVGGDEPATAALGWLFALIAVGAGIIWHLTGGADQRRRVAEGTAGGRVPGAGTPGMGIPGTPWLGAALTETGSRAYLLRFVVGGVLVAVGTIGLAFFYVPVGGAGVVAVIYGLLFALLALAGVGLVAAPVLWRIFGALREEREARIREQERAEFAAMVHDQVLHTLALIQRNATPGSTVYRLARAQERTLRGWLYKPTGSPTEKLAAALEEAAGEVEDAYAVTVEVVVVGDADTDERLLALVAAAREAMVNAARHAQVPTVSLYAEVEPPLSTPASPAAPAAPGQASVFVRDRGIGFDPASVDSGRHGVRGSIIGRMERHGGKAEIISTPGEGTEVRLTMPLPGTQRRDESDE
jgi:signal transduction histidine kinase